MWSSTILPEPSSSVPHPTIASRWPPSPVNGRRISGAAPFSRALRAGQGIDRVSDRRMRALKSEPQVHIALHGIVRGALAVLPRIRDAHRKRRGERILDPGFGHEGVAVDRHARDAEGLRTALEGEEHRGHDIAIGVTPSSPCRRPLPSRWRYLWGLPLRHYR